MRIQSFIFILIAFCFSTQSYAGFVFKSRVANTSFATAPGSDPGTDSTRRVRSRAEVFEPGYQEKRREERRQRREEEIKNQNDRKTGRGQGGGLGIAAFVCGCVFYWPLAIIFGAIAMKKGRKNWKLARAGFIIGLVEAVVYIMLMVMVGTFL